MQITPFRIFVFVTLITSNAYADNYQFDNLNVDAYRCKAKGFISSIKETINPSEFWLSQKVALDMIWEDYIETNGRAEIIEWCNRSPNSASRLSCINEQTERYNAARRCSRQAFLNWQRHKSR